MFKVIYRAILCLIFSYSASAVVEVNLTFNGETIPIPASVRPVNYMLNETPEANLNPAWYKLTFFDPSDRPDGVEIKLQNQRGDPIRLLYTITTLRGEEYRKIGGDTFYDAYEHQGRLERAGHPQLCELTHGQENLEMELGALSKPVLTTAPQVRLLQRLGRERPGIVIGASACPWQIDGKTRECEMWRQLDPFLFSMTRDASGFTVRFLGMGNAFILIQPEHFHAIFSRQVPLEPQVEAFLVDQTLPAHKSQRREEDERGPGTA